MAQATSNSLNDLATAFLIQALGLNPLLSPVLNSAGVAPGITDSSDVTATGAISALNANLATGIPTANSTVILSGPLIGLTNVSIQVQGTLVGTLIVQVSNDNTNWNTLGGGSIINVVSGGSQNSIVVSGVYNVNIASFAYARVTCSAFTSGNSVVSIKASDTASQVSLSLGLPTGTNSIGQVGLTTTGFAATSGAATQAKILTAATTNATSVKASGGKLFMAIFSNNAATAKYIHFYNKASAPTVGTDSPAFTITLPANTIEQPFQFSSDIGLQFTTGLAYSITGAAGDLDNTVTAINDVSGVLGYI